MTHSIIQVDAFADQPFTGNPAAVCLLDKPASEDWMQAVAMEMNLSETAFLYPTDTGYNLRWFTPASEVNLCGHATLASAFVLFSDNLVDKSKPVSFLTKSGELKASYVDGFIELDFPAIKSVPCSPPDGLLESLGVQAQYVAKAGEDYMVIVSSDEIVKDVNPDFNLLGRLPVRGVAVSGRSRFDFDFVSRFFAPLYGINEDPVTGSAHCALAPYWANELGKTKLSAYQASARGGKLSLELKGDRVLLSGKAVITLRGKLHC
ncbi:MAG: PhzF family phenazine biosynthesis protein [candidate division Zixibacteria bacterium]|nr:PhzF family phenazine biosynthesis protein [candidate division Zixibacteria bacterium]